MENNTKQDRILHITTSTGWRGGESQMLTIVDLLRDEKDQFHLVLCPENSEVEKKCQERGLQYTSVKRGSKISLSFIRTIIKTVKINDIHALQAHDSNGLTMSLLSKSFLKTKKLIYIRKRNNKISTGLLKRLKYNSPKINNILCVSEAVKKVLFPVVKDHSKIKVIYDGIDVEKYSEAKDKKYIHNLLKLDPDVKIVGNLAGLVAQKDIHTFIKAAVQIKKDSPMKIKFIIAGDGPLRKELENFANKMNIANDLIFLGFRSDGPELLKGFDVFMLSSKTEGLPLVVLEAFASQIPVVSTDAGGTSEAVIDGKSGFIVPVENAEKLAARTLQVLKDEKLAKEFTDMGEKLVREKFAHKVMKENYKNFYSKIGS